MTKLATILELRRRSDDGMYAVPYRSGRPYHVRRLTDGLIVERPTVEQRREAPDQPVEFLEVAGGQPATIHHINLGLVTGYLVLEGVYLLPTGEVAAVYNADAIPIG